MNFGQLFSFCLGFSYLAVSFSLPLEKESAKKRVSHELTNQEEDLKRLADKSSRSSVTLLQEDAPAVKTAKGDEPQPSEDDNKGEPANKKPWTSVVKPEIVARYLMQSGDLKNFINSLQDLVNEDKLKLSDAERYEQRVANAYRSLAGASTQAPHAPVKAVTSVPPLESSSAQPEAAKVSPEQSRDTPSDQPDKTSLMRERLAYVRAMQATVRRLFQEAVEQGNKKSEQTLRDFIDYVTQLTQKGKLQGHEVTEVIELMTSAISQELQRLASAAETSSKVKPQASTEQH